MHACVDRWIASCAGVDLSDDRESRMKIGESAGRQRTASSGELQKCFSLVAGHVDEDVDETNEAGAVGEKKGKF